MANEAPKSSASNPASSVALNSQTSRQAQELRAQKNAMMRDILNTKAQLDSVKL